MNVVNFLRANSLDQLRSQFSIKVKEYTDVGLIVLNYTIFSSENDPIVKECRSLILTTPDYGIVSRSFDRFLNYNETSPGGTDTAGVNDRECDAKEKIDGSLIKFYQFDGKWCVSTRGMAFAEGEINKTVATTTPVTYKQAVYEALNISSDDEFQKFCQTYNLNGSYTYILELTGKDNRVITEYNPDKYELWLLGIRKNDATGEYMDLPDLPNEIIKQPKVFSFPTMADCVNQANKLTDLQEGFVICDKTTGQPLYKVKSLRYVCYHNAVSNGNLAVRDIVKLIANEDWKEFIAYFPEHSNAVNEYFETVRRYFCAAEAESEQLRKTMKFDNDFAVFNGKQWKAIAITAVKRKETNFLEIFMKSYDKNKKLAFLLKAMNVQ